jgi:hypothetical protein
MAPANRARRRNGARPKQAGQAHRKSTVAIERRPAVNIIDGALFAGSIGYPLNRFTTVHFGAGGVADAWPAIKRLRKLASDWLALRGVPLIDVWIREDGPDKGAHFHWLLHVPPGLRLGPRQPGWLRQCGVDPARLRRGGIIFSETIGHSLSHAFVGLRYGETYIDNLTITLAYVLKGASPATRRALGLRQAEPGGVISGKRCGTSERIGPAARRRAGWSRSPDAGLWGAVQCRSELRRSAPVNTPGKQRAEAFNNGGYRPAGRGRFNPNPVES